MRTYTCSYSKFRVELEVKLICMFSAYINIWIATYFGTIWNNLRTPDPSIDASRYHVAYNKFVHKDIKPRNLDSIRYQNWQWLDL